MWVILHCSLYRYLIDVMGLSPSKAIEGEHLPLFRGQICRISEFHYARGHPLERQNYIDHLLSLTPPKDRINGDMNQPVLDR